MDLIGQFVSHGVFHCRRMRRSDMARTLDDISPGCPPQNSPFSKDSLPRPFHERRHECEKNRDEKRRICANRKEWHRSMTLKDKDTASQDLSERVRVRVRVRQDIWQRFQSKIHGREGVNLDDDSNNNDDSK